MFVSQSFSMNRLSLTLIIPYAGISPGRFARFVQLTDPSKQITKYTSSAQKILFCQAKGQKAAEVSQEAAEELVQGIPWGEEKQDF